MSPCYTSSDYTRTRQAWPHLALSQHHYHCPPPLPTLIQDKHVLVLSCLDVTTTTYHLCLCSYKTSIGLSSSCHHPSSDHTHTKRVWPHFLFHHHLSSYHCCCHHLPFLPVLIQDKCGLVLSCHHHPPPPLSALFQDECRLILPYRLCPCSYQTSMTSSLISLLLLPLVLLPPLSLLFCRPLLSTISGCSHTRQVQFHLVLSCLVLSHCCHHCPLPLPTVLSHLDHF